MNNFQIHNKVAWPVIAAALINIAIEITKTYTQIDLSDLQPDITFVVMGVVGYLVPSQ